MRPIWSPAAGTRRRANAEDQGADAGRPQARRPKRDQPCLYTRIGYISAMQCATKTSCGRRVNQIEGQVRGIARMLQGGPLLHRRGDADFRRPRRAQARRGGDPQGPCRPLRRARNPVRRQGRAAPEGGGARRRPREGARMTVRCAASGSSPASRSRCSLSQVVGHDWRGADARAGARRGRPAGRAACGPRTSTPRRGIRYRAAGPPGGWRHRPAQFGQFHVLQQYLSCRHLHRVGVAAGRDGRLDRSALAFLARQPFPGRPSTSSDPRDRSPRWSADVLMTSKRSSIPGAVGELRDI